MNETGNVEHISAETVPQDLSELMARLDLEAQPSLPRGPLVYFVRRGDEVKIGFTHRLSQRFVQLGSDLTLLGTVPGTYTTERLYHERFAHLRLHGEWFRADQELLDAIEDERSDHPLIATPGYQEIAKAFRGKYRAYLTEPSNGRLIYAQTNVGFALNMLANGETPERLAELERALGALERARNNS